MTDDRDRELARRLGEADPPDHRPGFWTDVRAELARPTKSTPLAPEGGAHLVENEDPTNSTSSTPDGGAHLVENELVERRRRRSHGPLAWLAAAAVTLVALVAGGVLLSGNAGDDDLGVITDPSDPTDPTDPTDREGPPSTDDPVTVGDGPLRPDGDVVVRGVGRPLAVDPTGTFLYVAAPAPAGGFGCEGAPAETVYVERVDGDGSDRRLAIEPSLVDATGSPLVAFSSAGEVAFVPRCEGFGSTVMTGRIDDDGTVAGITELSVPEVDSVVDIGFRGPGELIAAVSSPGDEPIRLVAFPTSPGEISELGHEGVLAIDFNRQGDFATVSMDGSIQLNGDEVGEAAGPLDVALSPSGHEIVVITEVAGLLLVDPRTGSVVSLDVHDAAAYASLEVPDDGTVVFAAGEGGNFLVTSFDLGSGDRRELMQSSAGQFVVAPGADVVFAAGSPTDPADAPPLLQQRLTR